MNLRVAENWFGLSKAERRETLEHERDVSGRPLHLLEKDIWVVWTLRTLFDSSMSVDLMDQGVAIPVAGGDPAADTTTSAGRVDLRASGCASDDGRTGPRHAAAALPCPGARQRLRCARCHAGVCCTRHGRAAPGDAGGLRYCAPPARHKSCFFVEKDAEGNVIDYTAATSGYLNIIPEGEARAELARDYAAMLDDDLVHDGLPFDTLLDVCAELLFEVNRAVIGNASGRII